MNTKFQSIFAQVRREHGEAIITARTKNSDILVVDSTNRFISAWTVTPTLNDNGDHVGGITGFLMSLGYAIKLLKPTRVIIVFDGKGGSKRRKDLYPEYKQKRAMPMRVNRAYEDMVDPKSEQEAMIHQMVKLIDFLRCLPVTVVSVDYIEADDAIGYIATDVYKKSKITIMSADRDFLQLVSDRVCVWSPIKKKIYGVEDIINEYGIHPTNFVYYRIFEGDDSDNIGGVTGIARKTANKLFPMLTEAKETSVEELLARAKDCINEGKKYASVVEHADIVARNYALMQLKTPNFTPSLQMQISDAVDHIYEFNKFQFIQRLTAHGMHQSIPNFHVWLQEVFQPLSQFATSS